MLQKLIQISVIGFLIVFPIYQIFHEDFSDHDTVTENYFLSQEQEANGCQLRAVVEGTVWLACVARVKANLDEWPNGLPSEFPPYEGAVAVPMFILDTVEYPRKIKPELVELYVKNPYKEYCQISSWITRDIRPIRPRCLDELE